MTKEAGAAAARLFFCVYMSALQLVAGGFAGDQDAEQFGQLRTAGRFGALDVGHEALADLQLIETGGNEFLDRSGHGALLSRGTRLVSSYIMRRNGGLGAVGFDAGDEGAETFKLSILVIIGKSARLSLFPEKVGVKRDRRPGCRTTARSIN